KLYGIRISLDELQEMIAQNFKTDCICAGNDIKMLVYITNESEKDSVMNFIIEKTKLFHRAFEIIATDSIPRNEAGKIIYNV
ncbi:MAG: hypothetical protein QNJ57_13470, partial [Flavobacteriaceae bacterium]|nr:hypothetical protein [Flavobacteriaceae bacterium]